MKHFDKQHGQQLVLAYKQNPTAESRNAAAVAHLEAVKILALQQVRLTNKFDADDLAQVGMIRILRVLDLYDPATGFLFWTYAQPSVWGVMRAAIRYANKKTLPTCEHPHKQPCHRRPENETPDLPNWLTDKQREILVRRFWLGQTNIEIGAAMGLTSGPRCRAQAVAQRMGRIVNEWRKREGLPPTYYVPPRRRHAFVSQN